jgi:Kdo2-lipid IVA lauroyltransferase/acyltransferase
METLLYFFARVVVAFIQALPLTWVARLGRWGGGLAYWLDKRHRRVALHNLTMCFGREQSPDQLRALAQENFRRLGENYACAVKTANMSYDELRPHVEFVGNPRFVSPPAGSKPQKVVVAIGHFGNFELYARYGQFAPAYQCGTTYRGLRQPSINRLMQSLRERSGCLYFERRFESGALKAFMNRPDIMMGFLSDQSGGHLRVPFLGHDCSTTAAPAIYAQRYHCSLITSICYRVGLAQWRIEVSAEIPTHEKGEPRSAAAIMGDVNRTFEAAVRRDPANWFWVHRRWKPGNSGTGVSAAAEATTPPHH